ncbi:hypothetical protein EXIGLDRAFT_782552 [Exidia glandulosa HHB12029]|uniref:Uncharacterized protein n=1 Tax=Exidia glandulosa HHB12029 TaxID=1314781 RepID=A0A166NKZ4_EXIGL|nr:hypothetical protein EXIGLDRAFT_782552 [Exidia glandulosa HHB12029]
MQSPYIQGFQLSLAPTCKLVVSRRWQDTREDASPDFPRSNASVFPPSPFLGAFCCRPLLSAGFPPSPEPGVTGFSCSPGPQQGLGFVQHQVRSGSSDEELALPPLKTKKSH